MPRFIYLIKARGARPQESGAELFFSAWAERVWRSDGQLRAENIQVPVVSRKDDGWRMEGRRLPDRTFAGQAYTCRAPAWYAAEAPAPPVVGEGSGSRALGESLRTTPLGRMCLHSEVRRALAQDRLAAALEPLLRLPDLLEGEDRLAEVWRVARPEAAAQAAAAGAALRSGDGGAEERSWHQRLRTAALRRLDAAAVGREIYRPCPAFFGEPYLPFAVRTDLTLKAGLVRDMRTWPDSEREAQSAAWRADAACVAAVEDRLLPGLGPGRPRGGADSSLAAWLALAAVRAFETRSPWPLFPRATALATEAPPAGFVVRIQPETMRNLGGSYRTLASAGLSPFLAQPFAEYCETRRDLLAAWSEDGPGLALARWGSG